MRSVLAAGAVLFLLACCAVGLSVGAADLPANAWLSVIQGRHGPESAILLSLRLPRVTTAVLTGGALAMSGAVFQALLRNPLAEPYLLGVSSGAALGAVLALAIGLPATAYGWLPGAALLGGLAAIVIVFQTGRIGPRLDTRVLLLAGVVVGSFFAACVLLLLTFVREGTLRSAFHWTLGSLGGASWGMILGMAAYAVPAAIIVFGLSRHLDALSLGEETAVFLGTDAERVKKLAYVLASLLAAASVAVAGVIGFVGLVVPHAVRLAGARNHRTLLPLSFAGGGGALVLADAVARTAAAPMEIPVGVVTAFVGVPFFLLLLRRSYNR